MRNDREGDKMNGDYRSPPLRIAVMIPSRSSLRFNRVFGPQLSDFPRGSFRTRNLIVDSED